MNRESPLLLVALADVHGVLTHLPALEGPLRKADAVVLAGDITNFGGAEAADSAVGAVEAVNPNIAAVHGNCDRPEVALYLADRGMGVHGQVRRIGGLVCAGVGGALVCSGRTPSEADDTAMAETLDSVGRDLGADRLPLVLVTHQPAYGTTLDAVGGRHTGSRAIRAFIDRYHPVLAVSGHLHEAIGVDHVGATTLLNPGPFKMGRYAVVRIDAQGVTVELKTV